MKKKKAPKNKVKKAPKAVSKQRAKIITAPKNKSRRASHAVGIPTKASGLGVTPLGDKVLVKPIVPETTTASGIILSVNKEEKAETGVVVAVGPGRRNEHGVLQPMNVAVGDKVMFSKYGFEEVTVKGEEYYLINESSIQAVINE